MCVSLEAKEFHRISSISYAVTGSILVKGHPSVHLDGDRIVLKPSRRYNRSSERERLLVNDCVFNT